MDGFISRGHLKKPLKRGAVSFSVGAIPRGCPHVPNACAMVCGWGRARGLGVAPPLQKPDFRENETALLLRGVLNPRLLEKPGFLPNLRAITQDFAQKTRFLGSLH